MRAFSQAQRSVKVTVTIHGAVFVEQYYSLEEGLVQMNKYLDRHGSENVTWVWA